MLKKSIKSLLLATSALLMPLSGQAQDCCFDDQEAAPAFEGSDCCGGGKFSAEVDFLWWEFRHNNHAGTVISGTPTDQYIYRRSPKSKWYPGFRLGFNYEGCLNCWDLGVIWTHYDVNTHRGLNADGDGEIFVDYEGDHEFTLFSGSNHFKNRLDYVDIDISRDITLNCCFTFTPHIGVRGLWTEHKYRNGGSGTYISGLEPVGADFRAHGKHHSSAWGIEGGFWATWNVGCNFAVYGHVGGALLAFDHKFRGFERITNAENEGNIYTAHFKETHKSTSPMFNYTLGVQYLWQVCNWDLLLKAAWEQVHIDHPYHQWQGLTLGVEVKF